MVCVCRKHVKVALKQFTTPHVKEILKGINCKYCGEDAMYLFYYSHIATPITRGLNESNNHASAS
jgi:hypothetical protein